MRRDETSEKVTLSESNEGNISLESSRFNVVSNFKKQLL